MTETHCALYARVSSEAQTRDNTIGSQVTALHERIAADGFVLEPGHSYQDDGYSGSILLRPALERLRDAVASGHVERLYVDAPDRLARRYAHQALLFDEFRRSGDDLLLQVQGVIAEYERANILERSRRGRRHAARFAVVEAEAHIAWVGLDRMSLRQVCRQLEQIGCQTRTGATHWHASTIRGMLANPAYVGHAAFGRTRYLPPRPRCGRSAALAAGHLPRYRSF
jgi:site-specific DNA recombinase